MEPSSKPQPEKKPAQKSEQNKVEKPNKAFPVKLVLLVIVAILITLPGAGALWLIWQQEEKLLEVESRLDEIADLRTDISQLSSAQRQLNNQLSTLNQTQLEQGDALTKLQNQSPLSSDEIELEWALAEIKYLLNLANQRALLAGDVSGAQLALSLADQQIRELGDYRMQPLRELIAEEELALKAAGDTDVAGIAADMLGLIKAIDNLRVVSGPKQTFNSQTDAQEMQQSAWREAVTEIWTQLRSLVVIRQQQDAPAAVLMPEQRYFLYQNLRLQMETARFAALSGNQKMFEQSLQSAISWLEQYFVGDHRDAMLESLRNMQSQAISIETPDISGSLRWLKGFEP
jgi:uroporphyrin-3 C-methyltransferase